MLVAALLGIGVGAAAVFFFRAPAQATIPAVYRSTVFFPLYEPSWLPEGYFVDPQSFDATSQVITFTINDPTGKKVIVTEQPKPPQAHIDSFYREQLAETKTLRTPFGQATVGAFEGSPLAGLLTDQTWVLFRTVSAVDSGQFERIIQNIQHVQ